MPLVSVIVPIYKVEKYLRRCVDSLVTQTLRDIEIILVDDGSPDGCGKICDEYAEKDQRVKVIHQRNGGAASARNAGVKAAQGKYVAFVDGDDWIEKETYADLSAAAASVNADLVFYDFTLVKENGDTFISPYQKVDMPEMPVQTETALKLLFQKKLESFSWIFICERSLFFDRETFFPEGRRYEDTATVYRIVGASQKIAFVREKLYHYFQRDQSATHHSNLQDSRDVFLTLEEMEQYVVNFWPDVYPYFLNYQVAMLVWCYILYCKATLSSKRQDDITGYKIREKFYRQLKKVKLADFIGDPYLFKIILMKFRLIRPLIFLKSKMENDDSRACHIFL